ncbi:hypothetical protein B1812_16040 [Methylocystis bryophila]|uniref:Uncharacterized protein n=2 Tax=Methylocystis bryophila TaxID=655015 RepID=A0A1W6MXV6_9HYPH|nr:hypothetical protein B1812_16040 [Methylocystis bryophila]
MAAGAAGLMTLRAPQEITFTQAELQKRIDPLLDKDLPLKGPAAEIVSSLQARMVNVTIAEGRVDIAALLQGKLVIGPTFSLLASLRGKPLYEDGAFYFEPEDVRLEKFSLGEEGKLAGALAGLARLAGPGAAELLDKKRRELEGAAKGLAENAIKAELARRPFYRLKDDAKAELLRATLDTLAVEGDKLVIRFTLWRATPWAALGGAALLGGLVGVILASRR